MNINTRTLLVLTDGSWENDVAGLGAVLLDESTGCRLIVQDRVQDNLLDLWKDLVGDQLICQIELLAMVLVRWEWKLELSNRRILLFVDNNSARGGVVKREIWQPRNGRLSEGILFDRSPFAIVLVGGESAQQEQSSRRTVPF